MATSAFEDTGPSWSLSETKLHEGGRFGQKQAQSDLLEAILKGFSCALPTHTSPGVTLCWETEQNLWPSWRNAPPEHRQWGADAASNNSSFVCQFEDIVQEHNANLQQPTVSVTVHKLLLAYDRHQLKWSEMDVCILSMDGGKKTKSLVLHPSTII